MNEIKKEKRTEYMKKYQKEHPEKFLAASLKWQAKNKEHLKAYRKEYYKKYWNEKKSTKNVIII